MESSYDKHDGKIDTFPDAAGTELGECWACETKKIGKEYFFFYTGSYIMSANNVVVRGQWKEKAESATFICNDCADQHLGKLLSKNNKHRKLKNRLFTIASILFFANLLVMGSLLLYVNVVRDAPLYLALAAVGAIILLPITFILFYSFYSWHEKIPIKEDVLNVYAFKLKEEFLRDYHFKNGHFEGGAHYWKLFYHGIQ